MQEPFSQLHVGAFGVFLNGISGLYFTTYWEGAYRTGIARKPVELLPGPKPWEWLLARRYHPSSIVGA